MLKRHGIALILLTSLLAACGQTDTQVITPPIAALPTTPTPARSNFTLSASQTEVTMIPGALAMLPVDVLTDTPSIKQVMFRLPADEHRFSLVGDTTELIAGSRPATVALVAAPGTAPGTYTVQLEARLDQVTRPLTVTAHVVGYQELTAEQHANLDLTSTDPLLRTPERLWFASSPYNALKLPTISSLDPVSGAVQAYPLANHDDHINGLAAAADSSVWASVPGRLLHLIPGVPGFEASPYLSGTDNYGLRYTPTALTIDQHGDVWFVNPRGGGIGRYTPATKVFTTYALPSTLGPGADLTEITATPDGSIWMTQNSGSALLNFNPATERFSQFPTPTPNAGPRGLKVAADGQLWIAEGNVDKLGRFDPASTSFQEYTLDPPKQILGVSDQHPGAVSLSFTPAGDIWISEAISGSVLRFTPSTGKLLRLALPALLAGPAAIAADPDGSTWVIITSPSNSTIGHVTP